MVELCGIVYASEAGFLAKIAYPGAEGNGANRTAAVDAAAKRFEMLYVHPMRDGATPQLNGNYDAARLAVEQGFTLPPGQRWVVENTRIFRIPGGEIELTFYRQSDKPQQVSHRRSLRDALQQTDLA